MAAGRSRAGRKRTVGAADEAPHDAPHDAPNDAPHDAPNDARPATLAQPVAPAGDDGGPVADDGTSTAGSGTPAEGPSTGGTAGDPEAFREPSRGGRVRALLICLLAWSLPGFGHLALGQWLRGMAFSSLVAASATVGVALHGRLYWFGYGFSAAPIDPLPNVESPLLVAAASLVSVGLGLPAIALRWLAGYQGDVTAPGYEYGTAFLLTAGLMNVLLVLDAWDEAR